MTKYPQINGNWVDIQWHSHPTNNTPVDAPIAGDDVDLNGFAIVVDTLLIPSDGGFLNSIISPGKAGCITVNLSTLNYSPVIKAITITAGTRAGGIIEASGASATYTLTVLTGTGENQGVFPGTVNYANGVFNASTGTVNITKVNGGNVALVFGVYTLLVNGITNLVSPIIFVAGKGCPFGGFVPNYNPTATDYIQIPKLGAAPQKFYYDVPEKENVRTIDTVAGVQGTLNLDLYTLISGVVAAGDVRYGTARYSGGSTGTCYVPMDTQTLYPVAVDVSGTGRYYPFTLEYYLKGHSAGLDNSEEGTYVDIFRRPTRRSQ